MRWLCHRRRITLFISNLHYYEKETTDSDGGRNSIEMFPMAGLIMIRRERDGLFHARPTFVCKGMGYNDPKPEGKWTDPWMAFLRLIPYLPEPYQTKARGVDKWRMYHAPEYIDMSDRCVEIDGHKPNKTEWAKRREDFLRAKELGNETY